MQDERIHLLLVEDNPGDARLVCEILRHESNFEVMTVDCLAEALGQAQAEAQPSTRG